MARLLAPQRFLFAAIAVATALAGTVLWIAMGPSSPRVGRADISPSALFAATFTDLQGSRQSLGQFEGRVLVVNFWATWCAPCREEMPGLSRLQDTWASKGVRFLGLSSEDPAQVSRFKEALDVTYPLWIGGDEVGELSRRLGNRAVVLPHTVVFDRSGRVVASKVGIYPEDALAAVLGQAAESTAR